MAPFISALFAGNSRPRFNEFAWTATEQLKGRQAPAAIESVIAQLFKGI
jgi:hypothetical protein